MSKKNRLFCLAGYFVLTLFVLAAPAWAAAKQQTVLATTFPIYQIVRNIVQDRQEIQVRLMLPSQMGCPHDYALTPQDMRKVAKADILVINGLGMEEFLGAPIKKVNPTITVIDSSEGIKEILQYDETGCDHDETGHAAKGSGDNKHLHQTKKVHHCCHHHGTNPHLFASPRMAARLAVNIAAHLGNADPRGADFYTRNAAAYAQKMNILADEMLALGKRLKNNKIVEPHGVFDYLARDMQLEIVAVMLAHGQQPSAAGLRYLAKTIKKQQAGAIFTEPQYPQKVGITLAKETGIPVTTLDPVATGPEDAPLDYYETVMRQNMKTLEQSLGIR